jgi:restriction system protein
VDKLRKQAEFTKWMGPLLDALRRLGGKAKPRECSDWIAERLGVSVEERQARLKSGNERFHNQVQWARMYLVWEGLIDASERGVWKLTPLGSKARLTEDDSRRLFLKWVEIHARERASGGTATSVVAPEEPAVITGVPEDIQHQEQLMQVLQNLPPEGFERICKRILSECGFERVVVLGKSHDGGIDGVGTLRLNPFVTLKVMFQCKRIRRAVTRSQVGDFRNAVLGRAEKGIFITTGWFRSDAEKEATREGVPPIELVDGERLIELFEARLLGLRRRHRLEVDHSFFDEFR